MPPLASISRACLVAIACAPAGCLGMAVRTRPIAPSVQRGAIRTHRPAPRWKGVNKCTRRRANLACVLAPAPGDGERAASRPEAPQPLIYSKPAVVGALVIYLYFVFLSDVLPGPSALTLDPATWKEAFALSTNFWLVLPLLGQGPVVHPGLEAIFNLDLIWAALFSGFLLDGRAQPVPFGRFLLAMQFLTAPVYLTYLALRDTEGEKAEKALSAGEPAAVAIAASLGPVERAAESRVLPAALGVLTVGVLCWGAFGRPEFGDLQTRTESLLALLQTDRLGSSFVVDIAVFSACQGALVGDDLRRRTPLEQGGEGLQAGARWVPLFGLFYYLLNRPPLPDSVVLDSPPPRASAKPSASPQPFVLPRLFGQKKADSAAPVRAYFDAWNRREMDEAADCVSPDCVYEDTLFAGKLVGREQLRAHLLKCAAALPPNFRFALDDVSAAGELVGTRWHVELADSTPLPLARGASMYKVVDGLIVEGFGD